MAYRAVAAVPGAIGLLGSSVIGRIPLGTTTIAVLLFVHDLDGSFAAAGVVVAAFTLTGALAAPVQGALIDRAGALPVLAGCALGHAGGLLAITLAGQAGATTAALAAIAAATGALLPPISSAARAVWPSLAPEQDTRDAGYALDATSQELIWILGPLLTGAAIAVAGPASAVLMSAALTLAGTALFAAAPPVRAYRPGAPERGASPLRAPGMRRVLVCVAAMGFGLGASEVAFPAVAVALGHAGLGPLLLALMSVASAAGGLWWGRRRSPLPLDTRHGVLLAVLACLTLPMAAAQSVPAALVLSLVAGVAWSPVLACQYALVAQLAPAGAITTTFTWSISAVIVGLAAGSAVTGPLVDATTAHVGFLLAAAGYGAGSLVALSARRAPAVVA